MRFNLKKYTTQEEVLRGIDNLKSKGGTTAIGAGIEKALTQSDESEGARPGIATKVMVVFTDGWSNKGPDPERRAKDAVNAGFEMYTVAYTVGDNDFRQAFVINLGFQTCFFFSSTMQ